MGMTNKRTSGTQKLLASLEPSEMSANYELDEANQGTEHVMRNGY